MHLRNAPTPFMKAEGYGAGYEYPHDAPDAFVARRNLPEGVAEAPFYEPGDRGAEKAIAERLAAWRARKQGA
jgi:putative ATPase